MRSAPGASTVRTRFDLSNYAGHRILEAMRKAPRYADEGYAEVRSAFRLAAGPILILAPGTGSTQSTTISIAEKLLGERVG